MWKYIIMRLFWILIVLICVTFIIFTITYLAPGDPAKLLLSETGTPTNAEVRVMRAKLGIDKPYIVQLSTYLYNTFIKFDFGISWNYQVPVTEELLNRLPRTILIGILTMFTTSVVSIALGIVAALNRDKWPDYGLVSFCMVLIAFPEFWFGYMLILIFAIKLKWLPMDGIGDWTNYILPVLAGSLSGIAGNARLTRSSVLESLYADFVDTVRAKGQKEHIIILRHVFPNALLPILTVLGGRFGTIVGGTVIIERVFSIPGIGLYLLNGLAVRDYPVIRGCTLFLAAFTALSVLLTDLCYAWIDPRIKEQYSSGSGVKKVK